MNSCTDTQIKIAYEQENMTPEQIADDLGFSVESIKSKLMQCSSSYRKACGQEQTEDETLNFSKDQLRQVNEVIFGLAIGAEDEHLRAKMATYVRDDVKGRKEVVRNMGGTSFNIFQFNELLANARNGANELKRALAGSSQQKAIEV